MRFVVFLIGLSFLFVSLVYSMDSKWQFITLSEENLYEIYFDRESFKVLEDGYVAGVFKFYPGERKRQNYRESFLKDAERFKKELGEDAGELPKGWEKLLEAYYEESSIYFGYKVNCKDKKIYVIDNRKVEEVVSLKFVIDVAENSPSEKIYNFLCELVKNRDN